jgi:hypothetical protein
MDSLRQREQFSKRLDWMADARSRLTWSNPGGRPVEVGHPGVAGIWHRCSGGYYLSQWDIGPYGLEHALSQVPGIVIR